MLYNKVRQYTLTERGLIRMTETQVRETIKGLALTAIEKQNVEGKRMAADKVKELFFIANEIAEFWGWEDAIDEFILRVDAPK